MFLNYILKLITTNNTTQMTTNDTVKCTKKLHNI